MTKASSKKANAEERPVARWPGLALSLLVPGFGLFRAGKYGRGAAWFLGIYLGSLPVAMLLAAESVPVTVGLVCVALFILASIVALIDSYRPGRMNTKLWMLYAVLLLIPALIPPPPNWVSKLMVIPTSGMSPTLKGADEIQNGDHIMVNRLSYRFGKPERGDIVVFRIDLSRLDTGDRNVAGIAYFAKRIVGMPGEKIQIRSGSVFTDGKMLDEAEGIPAINYMPAEEKVATALESTPTMDEEGAYIVGENEYFVMGDNSANSFDSRYWGCVAKDDIIGKVTKVVYPFPRMGVPGYTESED